MNRKDKIPRHYFLLLIPELAVPDLFLPLFLQYRDDDDDDLSLSPSQYEIQFRCSISSRGISRRHLRKAIRVHSNLWGGDEFSMRVILFEQKSQTTPQLGFLFIYHSDRFYYRLIVLFFFFQILLSSEQILNETICLDIIVNKKLHCVYVLCSRCGQK